MDLDTTLGYIVKLYLNAPFHKSSETAKRWGCHVLGYFQISKSFTSATRIYLDLIESGVNME